MYKWTHEYEDFNGSMRKEDFYFHFTTAELQDLEWRTPGGIEAYMDSIIATRNGQKLADFFKNLIKLSYGVKTPDGRSFIKSPEVFNNFRYTQAYSDLYMLLATNDEEAAKFVNGVFPKDKVKKAREQKEMAEKAGMQLMDPSKEGISLSVPENVAPSLAIPDQPQVAPTLAAPTQPQVTPQYTPDTVY